MSFRYVEAIRTAPFGPDRDRDLPCAGIETTQVDLVAAGPERGRVFLRGDLRLRGWTAERRRDDLALHRIALRVDEDHVDRDGRPGLRLGWIGERDHVVWRNGDDLRELAAVIRDRHG